jgi:hypothetical protein
MGVEASRPQYGQGGRATEPLPCSFDRPDFGFSIAYWPESALPGLGHCQPPGFHPTLASAAVDGIELHNE